MDGDMLNSCCSNVMYTFDVCWDLWEKLLFYSLFFCNGLRADTTMIAYVLVAFYSILLNGEKVWVK